MILPRITRNRKIIATVKAYAERRTALKKLINQRRVKEIDINDHMSNVFKLDRLPRRSLRARIRNRCFITGRPRRYESYFGISLLMLRKFCLAGMIPGVRIASW